MSDETNKPDSRPEPQDLPSIPLSQALKLADIIENPEDRFKAQAEILLQGALPEIRRALYDVVLGKIGAAVVDVGKAEDVSGRSHTLGVVVAMGDIYTVLTNTLEAHLGAVLPPEVTPQ